MAVDRVVQAVRRWKMARQGASIDVTARIGHGATVSGAVTSGSVSVGAFSECGRGVELHPWGGRITIGRRVFIGPYVVIYGHGGVDIGDDSLISMHCSIVSSNHTIPSRNSLIRDNPDILLPTKIGKDVWIGAGARVLGGVTIGDGCIVGAGAVVASDLPSYSVALGVPARVVGRRPE